MFVQHPSSYRDPSGFIFEKDGLLYRQVNLTFKNHYEQFISGGCYAALTAKGWLIPHQQINENLTGSANWYTTLLPEKVEYISYPYEWSFDMLKDAALLTLQLMKEGLSFGMILKDATPYNIQWHKGNLVFIDTLSFEQYDETQPWIAYRQFCESFLAPLLLMHYSGLSLHQLFLAYPDGIPIGVAKKLLPWKSRWSLHAYLHIHLHAGIASGKKSKKEKKIVFSKQKLLNLLSSLETVIKKTQAPHPGIWSGYYDEAAQRDDYLEQKKKIITDWIAGLPAIKTAIDLGANEGEFSMLLAGKNIRTVAADFEPHCINSLYGNLKKRGIKNIQPLVLDIALPSPAIGINNLERSSFTGRFQSDLVVALALIHHLCIGKNMSFANAAAFFKSLGQYIIIEFVPKQDEKVRLMLQQKKDIYSLYNEEKFTEAFLQYFSVIKNEKIQGTSRTIFLLRNRLYQ